MTPEQKEILDLIKDHSLEGVRENWGFHDEANPGLLTASVRDKDGSFIYLDTILQMLQESLREIASAKQAERERCIKLVCECCAEGSPLTPSLMFPSVQVHELSDGSKMVCPADLIRTRANASDEGGGK